MSVWAVYGQRDGIGASLVGQKQERLKKQFINTYPHLLNNFHLVSSSVCVSKRCFNPSTEHQPYPTSNSTILTQSQTLRSGALTQTTHAIPQTPIVPMAISLLTSTNSIILSQVANSSS